MENSEAWRLTNDLHVRQGKSEPFSAAIRASRMPMVLTDPHQPDNPIIYANQAFLNLTGYSREEVTGKNCRFLQGKDTDIQSTRKIAQAIAAGQDISIDLLNYRKNGETFWNGLYISPVIDESGIIQYFFASQVDVSERKSLELERANLQKNLEALVRSRTIELEDALTTSKLLLHEVDHRVKNNLQMIGAMLMLQSMSIPDQRIKNTLQEMLERVDALGLVHKRLYQSESILDFDLGDFTREIAANLVAAAGRNDINLMLQTESIKIKADSAAPIALVINETITNALKHAFPPGMKGDLHVSVMPEKDACMIRILDNGVGMNNSVVVGTGFGSTLVTTLIKQLGATFKLSSASPGTCVEITLSL
ncbi:MAG: PAS domain-containing protein [Beijerinckiaceae bacterium]